MPLQASWIAQATGGDLRGADVDITSVETDSRNCRSGSLYVARRGENSDGHDYAAAALAGGASCLLVERFLDLEVPQIRVSESTTALGQMAAAHLRRLRTTGPITVIGITGSAGKTTTKDLLGQILSAQAPTVFPQLSFNNEVGCPLTILRANEETRYLVLEMGASGEGHLRYLTEIAPLDVACVLMVGSAHLGGFGSPAAIVRAKAELVSGLVPTGTAVLNQDDPAVVTMASQVPRGAALEWFSRSQADQVVLTATGISFTTEGGTVQLPLIGEHQVMNALAAIACAEAAGIPREVAVTGLSSATVLSPHRMVVREEVSFAGVERLLVIDDSYNANPDSLRAALRVVSQIAPGRKIVVFGEMLEMGEDSPQLHDEMVTEMFADGVELVIAVGDGARGVENLTKPGRQVFWSNTTAQATKILAEVIEAGDTILVKGSNGSGVWQIADTILEASA